MATTQFPKANFLPVLTIVLGLMSAVLLSRALDRRRPPLDQAQQEENLYVNGATARRLSLGFKGLIADWYWMRSLQYVGRKVLSAQSDIPIDDLGSLNLKLLAPLLDTCTTLDPAFIEPYQYAAIVLPAIDVNEAIRLTKKGIAANPNSWRLYQHLGYIYWQRGEYSKAAEVYGAGSEVSGAPPWMRAMKAKMSADGGSRSTAREIYKRMMEGSTDKDVRSMASLRLLQLDSLDQRDEIRKVLNAYHEKRGNCPKSWVEIALTLQSLRLTLNPQGAPLDPSGAPYQLVKNGCDVDLHPQSPIPAK